MGVKTRRCRALSGRAQQLRRQVPVALPARRPSPQPPETVVRPRLPREHPSGLEGKGQQPRERPRAILQGRRRQIARGVPPRGVEERGPRRGPRFLAAVARVGERRQGRPRRAGQVSPRGRGERQPARHEAAVRREGAGGGGGRLRLRAVYRGAAARRARGVRRRRAGGGPVATPAEPRERTTCWRRQGRKVRVVMAEEGGRRFAVARKTYQGFAFGACRFDCKYCCPDTQP